MPSQEFEKLTRLMRSLENIDRAKKIHRDSLPLNNKLDFTLRDGKFFKTPIDTFGDKVYEQTKNVCEFVMSSSFPNSYGIMKRSMPLISEMAESQAFKETAEAMQLNMDAFLELVYSLWFQRFHDGNSFYDKSGFIHHFIGNLDGRGSVSGLHNWYGLYLREERGDIEVNDCVKDDHGKLFKVHFTDKKTNTRKMSTIIWNQSPEVSISMYTFALYFSSDPFNDPHRRTEQLRVTVDSLKEGSYNMVFGFAHGHLITAYNAIK